MKTELTQQLEGLTAREIKDVLESMCSSAEEMQIRRELRSEEKTQIQQELATKMINRAVLEEQFEKAKQEYKTKDNPLKLRTMEIVRSLRTNAIEMEGMVYSIPNQETGQMETYDETGAFLQSRPLLPEEKQRSLVVDSMLSSVNEKV